MNKAKKFRKRFVPLIFLMMILLIQPGCVQKATGPEGKTEIRIAEQFGIAYAPLQIMREQGLLERELPGVKVSWKQFGGPTPIREAMLAGEVDFGFMGPAPVLVGIDNGMEWKYATGISFNQVALVTDQKDIRSLKDFKDHHRIAILSPGSTQHILLSIASDQVFGNPNQFDNQIVSLSHPDAMDALMADTEIVAHFATPPYLDRELEAGMHIIATGEEIMGQPFTFITGVAPIRFYEDHPAEYEAVLRALNQAIDYINNNLDEAVALLAPIYGIDEETLKAQMTYRGTIYSNELTGLDKLAKEMHRIGILKNPIRFEDVVFEKAGKDVEEGNR